MASEVDVGGCDIAQALMVALVVIMVDKGLDLGFKIARQEVVFQQDAVLQSLMPPLDFALSLGAMVLECTGSQPFARAIQREIDWRRDVESRKLS